MIFQIDSIGRSRENNDDSSGGVQRRVLTTLLNELDGIDSKGGVYLLAASNSLDHLDSALIRPGRIDQSVHLGLPTKDDAKLILSLALRNATLAKDVDMHTIIDLCFEEIPPEELTCAWICNFAREVVLNCLRETLHGELILQKHFIDTITSYKCR
jgi:ATP-dependent 26S proteasome regulatory subunit